VSLSRLGDERLIRALGEVGHMIGLKKMKPCFVLYYATRQAGVHESGGDGSKAIKIQFYEIVLHQILSKSVKCFDK
jgi:hypothetical protein